MHVPSLSPQKIRNIPVRESILPSCLIPGQEPSRPYQSLPTDLQISQFASAPHLAANNKKGYPKKNCEVARDISVRNVSRAGRTVATDRITRR